MEVRSIPYGETPSISLTVNGNLRLTGWDRQEVRLRSSSASDQDVEQQPEALVINCAGDCTIDVPFQARILVKAVHGNASLQDLSGDQRVEHVDANLTLRQVGPIQIELVRGNLIATTVRGDLSVSAIYGNASLHDLDGDLRVDDAIYGKLTLNNAGGVEAIVHGNASLQFTPVPGGTYRLETGGNLHCQLPAECSASVSLVSRARSIQISLQEYSRSLAASEHSFTLGDGEATLDLQAGGRIHLTGDTVPGDTWGVPDVALDENIGSIAEEINQQIALHMEELEHHLNTRLAHISEIAGTAGISPEVIEGIVKQARQASERAARRAQIKAGTAAQRAQEKLARRLEKARRETKRRARAAARQSQAGWRVWGQDPHGVKPEAQSEPVTEEEILTILQLLERKQISVEEAEKLLAALEGSDG